MRKQTEKAKRLCACKRKDGRDLPLSNLGMEVLELLQRCWCRPGGSGRVLSHPCKVVLTEPRRRETGEMGQQGELAPGR